MTSPSQRVVNRFLQQPWFVTWLAAYPVLALAAVNLNQIRLGVIIRPLILSIVGAWLVWSVLTLFLKSWQRSALLTALLILLFFSYGHVYWTLREISPSIGRGRYLVPLWGVLAGLSIFWATRKALPLARITLVLNLAAGFLTLISLTQIGRFHWLQSRVQPQIVLTNAPFDGAGQGSWPDIYYIILDSYGRSDTLQAVYDIDNTFFLRGLSEMGFYVAPCSQSNYAQTQFAIASTLNMDYLEKLGVEPNNDANDALLVTLSRQSLVRRILEANGYRVVSFASGFIWSEWPNADWYLSPPLRGHLSEFEALLLRSSFGLALADAGIVRMNVESATVFRERTVYALEMLPKVAALEGPKFVFVHIIAPHPPFVFGPKGEVRDSGSQTLESHYTSEQYRQGYREQVEFISASMIAVLQQVISASSQPPIIILQGDHGPGFSSWRDRMKILNAYFFPSGARGLYSSISPVNSFRLVFNAYFQADYPLLHDRSYFSSYSAPYDFQEMANDCAVEVEVVP